MNKLFRRLLALALPVLAACAGMPARDAAPAPRTPLLLISIDGFRADYIERGLTPTLDRLAREGVRAEALVPAFPSLTFPNHYTLVTGLEPDHHGIVGNTMADPALGHFKLNDRAATSDGRWWDEGTPLWVSADEQGLRTATMFWPGSEAEIHGHRPDRWFPYDGKVSANQRVDQVLAWLDLPPAERPGFLTLYFDDVDHAGHASGPDSAAVNAALGTVDAALARLRAGLAARGLLDRLNLVIVSDHGMASVAQGNSVLVDQLIPLDQVEVVGFGIVAGFNPRPGHDFSAIERQLSAPQQHMQCWDKARIPARFHFGLNPRVPQLVCVADVGWRISTSDYVTRSGAKLSRGEHGYDNRAPEMRALFVARGPAFRAGLVVPEFANVDVYPLLAHLIGVTPAANDGRAETTAPMLHEAATTP